ncbi:Uncharacterised protein [Mycobacteroides abscessus subsp. abscessus]|nr:Uncharacterised protein [Mycobacteroides abscessus subsp. abscessus]SHX37607.1 Uncharacterised protein [Mycobacteroides abscessus subsp. abscessus]SIA58127.1 Uncharacterised protein [Mycobacteroides abscessus subsp. abscessus]SIA65492.1 Uncharacterised protein [Mycobacteroides abscessus subsp. abscessus]SIB57887.1 Uncharacterised protein [Mycobacteroides abscessus subsp. abscessus]
MSNDVVPAAEVDRYNDDEIEIIKYVSRYGTRGMATFYSAEGPSISREAAKNLASGRHSY